MMRSIMILTLGLLAALGASTATAEVKLVKAEPAEKADGPAPAEIRLQFSDKLTAQFSGVGLMKAEGPEVAIDAQVSPDDPSTLVAKPKAPLAPGAYMVMWQAQAADGKNVTGDYYFTVK